MPHIYCLKFTIFVNFCQLYLLPLYKIYYLSTNILLRINTVNKYYLFKYKKPDTCFRKYLALIILNLKTVKYLFNCNLSTFSFKLCLDIFSFFLRNSFFDNLWSSINKILSFFKTKTCSILNNLDNLNLVRTNFC